jgi:hypothetical protein
MIASPYPTSAILHSPSQLKTDARNVYLREWTKKNRESVKRKDARWRQGNLDRRREWDRLKYERNAMHLNFYHWLRRYDWPFQHLTWKTHIPIKTEDKVKRACSTCGRYESQGLKIWWKRRNLELSIPAAYDCFDCFCKPNPEHVVPTEYAGFALEDVYHAMKEARQQHVKSGDRTTASLSAADKQHVRLSDKSVTSSSGKFKPH